MEALNVSGAAQDALYLVIRLLLEWCEKLSGEQKPKRFGLSSSSEFEYALGIELLEFA